MDLLGTLSVALGLATLAGINLYLTVFVAGMAIRFGWVTLPPDLAELSALGNHWLIVVAGILYFLQFFADKVPWMDTINDAVHTFIRPIGGAMLAVLAMGEADPAVKAIAALLAGGVALTAHAAKAGSRLVANASPEPLSNIGLSVGEDVLVLGGLGLLAVRPEILLVITLVLVVGVWIIFPRLLRSIRCSLWLAWRKLNSPSAGHDIAEIPVKLPARCELALRRAHASTEPITMAVRCLSGGGPRLPRNHFGWLTRLQGGRLFFVGPRWRTPLVVEIPLEAAMTERESRFLSEKLLICRPSGNHHTFVFERGHRVLADRVADKLTGPTPLPIPETAVAA